MSKLDLEKAEEPEIKLPTSDGSQKKQEPDRFADDYVHPADIHHVCLIER